MASSRLPPSLSMMPKQVVQRQVVGCIAERVEELFQGRVDPVAALILLRQRNDAQDLLRPGQTDELHKAQHRA